MKPEFVIIHHSLTKDGTLDDWKAIRRYHMEHNGWKDIGYHLGVENLAGSLVVQTGRRLGTVGAHTKELGMNRKSVGICVVGNYDLAPPPDPVLHMVRDLCWMLMVNLLIPAANVLGHREVGKMAGFDWEKGQYKTCPGSKFSMDALREMLLGKTGMGGSDQPNLEAKA